MAHTQVFVFGNPDLEVDSLPIRLLPKLQEAFPEVHFEILDPNEDWDVPQDMLIIDTVINAKEVAVFTDLSQFIAAPRVTCHDFDGYANLLFMKKLGKIKSTTIVGIPAGQPEDGVLTALNRTLSELLKA